MTADLIAAFHEVFGVPTYTPPPDPASHEDEDTLRRSFGGLSRTARREQRTGRYFPTQDRDGIDREGWAHGADYGRQP